MILRHFLYPVLGVLILSSCTLVHSAAGQDFQGGNQTNDPLFRSLDLNPLQSLSMSRSPALTETRPLEGPVDPESYLVGPGDIFTISVGGGTPVVTTSRVSADGLLPILEYGAVEVAGLTLQEVKDAAALRLKERFENVNINVTLYEPRQFVVHVAGAVQTPGRYVASPVTRVSSVIALAYVDTTRIPVGNRERRPSFRNVLVKHSDGTEDRVDILRYHSSGSFDHNPYLRDGDTVVVPTFDPGNDALFISGDLTFPGTYDYRPDDTLHDVLVLASGQEPPPMFREIRVLRSSDGGTPDVQRYDASASLDSIRVQQRDQIHAVIDPTHKGSASVSGWVEYPGDYPILPGRTTVTELIGLAGGLREGALARGAVLERRPLQFPQPAAIKRNAFGPDNRNALLRPDSLRAIHATRLSGMDFISQTYATQELLLQSMMPIDVTALGESDPFYVQDGDKLLIPRDDGTVFVFGQVNRPGYVPVRPSATFEDYLAASGGFSVNAGDYWLIEAGTNRYIDPRKHEIRSGDMIFVDRDEKRGDSPQLQRILTEDRRADLDQRSRNFQVIFQSISAASAIVTTYLLLRREF